MLGRSSPFFKVMLVLSAPHISTASMQDTKTVQLTSAVNATEQGRMDLNVHIVDCFRYCVFDLCSDVDFFFLEGL